MHLIDSFGVGGLENGLINIVNKLNTKKYIHVICSMTDSNDAISRIETDNFKWLGLGKKKADHLMVLKILHALKTNKPDIVHIRNQGPLLDGYIACKILKINRIIYSFHGKNYSDLNESINPIKAKIEEKILNKIPIISTLNIFMQKEMTIEKKIERSKIKILPNGVNTSIFYPPKDHSIDLKQRQLERQNKTIMIGAVGRLDRIKNYAIIVKACKILDSKFSNWKFCLAGDGDEKKYIEHIINNNNLNNKIYLLGNYNKIHLFLENIDIFIQPSLYEGFSNTILEAMAMKIPVIASNIGGNRNIVQNDVNGLLFNPEKEEELSLCILKYIQDRNFAFIMANNAYTMVKKKFTLDHMIDRYDKLYSGLMSVK